MQANYRLLKVFYFEDQRDRLIVSGIWPHVRDLLKEGRLRTACFERDWKRGPHIKLYHVPVHDEAEADLHARIETHLAIHPSRAILEPAEYRKGYEQMAWWEGYDESVLTLAKDNSIEEGSDDADATFWGGEQGLALAREYLAATSDVMVALIASRTRTERLPAALILMLIWASVTDESLKTPMYCFRSHAEAVFATPGAVDEAAKLRHVFEQRFEREKTKLAALADGIFGGRYPVLRFEEVREAMRTLRRSAYAAFQRGALAVPDSNELGRLYEKRRGEAPPGWGEIAKHSSFHARMTSGVMQEHMRRDFGFLTVRFTVNLLYVNLAQLGMKPLERYQFCWLLARLFEETRGFDDFHGLG